MAYAKIFKNVHCVLCCFCSKVLKGPPTATPPTPPPRNYSNALRKCLIWKQIKVQCYNPYILMALYWPQGNDGGEEGGFLTLQITIQDGAAVCGEGGRQGQVPLP
jgi:hypothetical protein